jgi:disulfide bond formation protein DsbB
MGGEAAITRLQRVLLLGWIAVAVCLLFYSAGEFWLLMEGAVRKPHNSRLLIAVSFALGIAIVGSVIGAYHARTDGFQAMQFFGGLIGIYGMLHLLGFVLNLLEAQTAEVRDWNLLSALGIATQGVFWCGFGAATLWAFRKPPRPAE